MRREIEKRAKVDQLIPQGAIIAESWKGLKKEEIQAVWWPAEQSTRRKISAVHPQVFLGLGYWEKQGLLMLGTGSIIVVWEIWNSRNPELFEAVFYIMEGSSSDQVREKEIYGPWKMNFCTKSKAAQWKSGKNHWKNPPPVKTYFLFLLLQLPPPVYRPELGTMRYVQPFLTDHQYLQNREKQG